jgi:hypothetical protein
MQLSDAAKRAVPQNQGYKLSVIIALWRIPCKLTVALPYVLLILL